MNCFEWHNHASDYLDGTLTGATKRAADAHLESCKECNERQKHYRLILTSIASQPRSALPIPIRKAPFTAALPRMDLARMGRTRWEQVPWFIRTTVEGMGIVMLILLGISNGPRLRSLFERNLEKNLSEFGETVGASGDGSAETAAMHLPLGRGKSAAGGPDKAAGGTQADSGEDNGRADEFASEGSDEDDPSAEGGGADEGDEAEVRVGNNEIWRFNMKTDSSHEIRPKIVEMLTSLNVPPSTPGLGGIEAPGGIQFDLMVPQSVVPALKKQLQKLAPPTLESLSGEPIKEIFTWYKFRSRRPVPPGKTHVVIWLAQMQ